MVIKRFEVYLVNLDPTIGSEIKKTRPCLIVSPDEMNRHITTVIEAPPGKAGTEVTGARWVNVVLGNLKRSLDGTCHAFGFFKYAERYLAEAAWRFNRRFDLKALVPRLLVTAAACPPWPESALRGVPSYKGC